MSEKSEHLVQLTAHQNRILSEWLIESNFGVSSSDEKKKNLFLNDFIKNFKFINQHTSQSNKETDWSSFKIDSLLDDCK